jgi:hypothetical protein
MGKTVQSVVKPKLVAQIRLVASTLTFSLQHHMWPVFTIRRSPLPKLRKSVNSRAFILRTLESARREIEQIERKFHRTIKSGQTERRAHKVSSARSRVATGASTGRAAPVQTAITNVLGNRRKGLTMARLQEMLPQFDQKSLLNATFAMRQKGLITFEKRPTGLGVYRWRD